MKNVLALITNLLDFLVVKHKKCQFEVLLFVTIEIV
jgi:hypothetical protein